MLVGAGTIYQQSYVGAKGDWIKSRHFRFYLDYPGSAQGNSNLQPGSVIQIILAADELC